MSTMTRGWLGITAAVMLLSACETEALPQSATVLVEATAPEALRLVVSTRFRTVGPDVMFDNADTIQITGNFEHTYALNEEARFAATLINDGSSPEVVRLKVEVDGRLQYDESGILNAWDNLPFLYRFLLTSSG